MWVINNRTPFAAEGNWIRDSSGSHWWLVAVRASFDIGPSGSVTLADLQVPPQLAPDYEGEPGCSSVRWDTDLLERKPSTDVVVRAAAHARDGQKAATVPVTLRVGVAIDKTVLVHGDRVYRRTGIGVGPSAPVPFTTRPIRYEWAFGGSDTSDPDRSVHRIDTRNPVGRGVAIRAKNLIDQPAHAIEYPRGEPAQSGPAGFGPIDRAWSPRRELAGTFDARWMSSKRPLLPDDYDPAYALCAPADQRIGGFLHGGETIELVNMTPDGLLRFAMPSRYLSFRSRFGSRYRAHSGQLATVHIDAQEFRLHLIWQSALEVAARDADYLDETQVVELARP